MNYNTKIRKKCECLPQARWNKEWKYQFMLVLVHILGSCLLQQVPTLISFPPITMSFSISLPLCCNFSIIPFIRLFYVVCKISDLPHVTIEQKLYSFFPLCPTVLYKVFNKHLKGDNQDSYSYFVNLINILQSSFYTVTMLQAHCIMEFSLFVILCVLEARKTIISDVERVQCKIHM